MKYILEYFMWADKKHIELLLYDDKKNKIERRVCLI